jgi:uncharacterized ferritin-like protein (DUF455 family)
VVDLFEQARACLTARDTEEKLELTREAAQLWRAGALDYHAMEQADPDARGAYPARLALVAPRELPHRALSALPGRGAFIHALAHIEFSAINLAWDAVFRFRGMPPAYYADWIGIALEEAHHFALLRRHLRALGYDYGDFSAHAGLWEMAEKTAHDVLARMALVPRVLEARGLDVTPAMIVRLREANEEIGARILETILHDEIGHVAAGSRWFRHVCRQRSLAPEQAFRELVRCYLKGPIKGPLNRAARLAAGFSEQELDALSA